MVPPNAFSHTVHINKSRERHSCPPGSHIILIMNYETILNRSYQHIARIVHHGYVKTLYAFQIQHNLRLTLLMFVIYSEQVVSNFALQQTYVKRTRSEKMNISPGFTSWFLSCFTTQTRSAVKCSVSKFKIPRLQSIQIIVKRFKGTNKCIRSERWSWSEVK